MKNSEDAITYLKFIKRKWVLEFLVGLNMEYDWVRVQVLGNESLTSLSIFNHKD